MKKQQKLSLLYLLSLGIFFSTKAIGQGCETLLMNGVFNTFNYNSGEYSSAEWHNFWCNGTVQKTSSSSQTNGALDVGVKIITLGMSFDDAREFQTVYKSIYCGSNTGATINISTNSVIQKVASPEILSSYVKCKEIENGGLQVNMSLRPEDKRVFVLDLKYTKAWGNNFGPIVKAVKFVPKNVISAREGTLKDNIGLKTGITYSLICERSVDGPVTVYVETEVGTYSANLPSFIPPPTDQDRVMNALPKGTILGWYNSNTIPKGWAICDGNNNSPNLIDRFAIGTSDASQLGVKVGNETHKHIVNGTTNVPNKLDVYNGDNSALQKDGEERVHHVHAFGTVSEDGSSIPPATKIIFIIKL